MTKIKFIRTAPATILAAGLIFLAPALFVSGCTITSSQKQMDKSLVSEEDPIFDKRFREMSFKQLSLKDFWTEGGDPESREPIPLHSNTFVELTESVKDGVVNIYTLRLEEKDANFGISPNDILPIRIPIVSDLLDFIPFKVPIPFNTQGLSLGSGFIINEEGYILTNAHVIHNALEIRVVLSDGKEYPAKIIGKDHLTDTALIKIEPEDILTVLPLGDSDQVKVGTMVLALGNPLGLRHSVSSGLISAKERESSTVDQYAYFLQTDSAINPGSSGGPLLNIYGEVIGINTAIVADAQLIGFAVPVNTVKEVMAMLVLGQTQRGWLGVQATPISIEDAVELEFNEQYGLLVGKVEEDSPAEKSGLRVRDIIVEVNDQAIKDFVIFRRKLLGLIPGDKVRMTIIRDGRPMEITSTLVKRESEE